MNVHNKTYYFVNLIYLTLFKEKRTKTNKTFIKFKINRKNYEKKIFIDCDIRSLGIDFLLTLFINSITS